MSFKVEIVKGHEIPYVIEGIAKATGKPYRLVKQKCYAHTGGAFPKEFEVMLDTEINAHGIGMYELKDSSFDVDPRGNLIIGRGLQLLREPFNKVA